MGIFVTLEDTLCSPSPRIIHTTTNRHANPMKRSTATLRITRSWEARRWASHDKSTLSKEALQRKVEAGLGHDADGKPLRVDTDAGTVSTAAGDLPLSPVFDPSWIKSRRRQRKADPRPPTGRLRKKLPLNPFGKYPGGPTRSGNNIE
jgi:hypothetical protein